MKFTTALTLLTLSSSVFANISSTKIHKSAKIIYGNDDRLDLRDVTDPRVVELARATAAMIPTWKLTAYQDPTTPQSLLDLLTLKLEKGLCEGQAFADQPVLGDCSGFLVGEKTLVTAGHCVDQSGCGENVWVFDYSLDTPGVERPLVEQSNVYSCARVIRSVLKESTKLDYAVIELDRAVTDRRPVRFRKNGKVRTNTPLMVIGYPSGLPTKVAGGARVLEQQKNYFGADLDTYGGNSGSPVFNAQTHLVEGILVRGDEDYVGTPSGCAISNVLAESKGSEQVTRITKVKEIMPRSFLGLF